MRNIISCATDGAPSMIGRYRGFIAHLKNEVPHVIAIHCVIHRQHLVAKNLSPLLHTSLKIAVKAINAIKTSPLSHQNDCFGSYVKITRRSTRSCCIIQKCGGCQEPAACGGSSASSARCWISWKKKGCVNGGENCKIRRPIYYICVVFSRYSVPSIYDCKGVIETSYSQKTRSDG